MNQNSVILLREGPPPEGVVKLLREVHETMKELELFPFLAESCCFQVLEEAFHEFIELDSVFVKSGENAEVLAGVHLTRNVQFPSLSLASSSSLFACHFQVNAIFALMLLRI